MAYTINDVADPTPVSVPKKQYTINDVADLTPGSGQVQPEKSIYRKAWEVAKWPEKKSREGLTILANAIPEAQTSDVTTNMILNTPKALAQTAAEVIPSVISPESAIGYGTIKALPLLAPAGKMIAKSAEGLSGLTYDTPGVLSETATNPTLRSAPGIEKARETYQAVKGANQIRPELQDLMTKKDFVEKALTAAKDGTITAEEALEARKALDATSKSWSDEGYRRVRDLFDDIAKQKFAEADIGYGNAVKADAMRNLFPLNKIGTPSIGKIILGGVVPPIGIAESPYVQSQVAANLGTLIQNPVLGSLSGAALANYKRFQEMRKQQNQGR